MERRAEGEGHGDEDELQERDVKAWKASPFPTARPRRKLRIDPDSRATSGFRSGSGSSSSTPSVCRLRRRSGSDAAPDSPRSRSTVITSFTLTALVRSRLSSSPVDGCVLSSSLSILSFLFDFVFGLQSRRAGVSIWECQKINATPRLFLQRHD